MPENPSIVSSGIPIFSFNGALGYMPKKNYQTTEPTQLSVRT